MVGVPKKERGRIGRKGKCFCTLRINFYESNSFVLLDIVGFRYHDMVFPWVVHEGNSPRCGW
jgi:hypothetical protein